MLKSQLEPSPQTFESSTMFVENIFDTVKKAKAAKAAKSLAESKLMTPYQYPYDDPLPVKKKRPRKNAKKNGKVKKPLTPKKKTASPRKPRILKDDAEKRKKATPVKSPRKYTKRNTKVPAPTDIDDEEAAFILSSISQRSFDSFYNRLNSCGSNKIHIPLDLPSLSVQNNSTESVKNQAYYVMLDHNYWVVEPPPEEVPKTPEVSVEIVKNETIQHNSNATETQTKNGIIYVEPPVKQEIVMKEEVNEFIRTGIGNISNGVIKVNEVNNNKVLKSPEKIPEMENVEQVACNNTSVKKRWLRQAASEIKSPPKKRKNVETMQVESKRRLEDLLNVVNCIIKPEEKQEQVEAPRDQIEVKKEEIRIKEELIFVNDQKVENVKIQVEEKMQVEEKVPIKENIQAEEKFEVKDQTEVKVQALEVKKEAEKAEDEAQVDKDQKRIEKEKFDGKKSRSNPKEKKLLLSPALTLKPEVVEPPKAPEVFLQSRDELKIKQPNDNDQVIKEEQHKANDPVMKNEQPSDNDQGVDIIEPSIRVPASEPISTPVKAENEAAAIKEEKDYDSDECDKRSWEIVIDFHRLQLKKLTEANIRFSDVQSTSDDYYRRDDSLLDQKFRHFDSLSNHYAPEAHMHFNRTRSPFTESPFSLLRKPEFISSRKTSLSIDTNQYSLIPPAFQRSVSDISLLDTRRSRWRGNETAPPSFYSSSISPFGSLGGENFYNKHEPYSKTNYSTYRAQKALCINSQTPEPVESLWEVQFDANRTKTESFLASFNKEDNTSTESVFKRAVVENNIPRKNLTAIAMTKTRTAVSDPRLNPSLQHEAKKEELVTPKKKVN